MSKIIWAAGSIMAAAATAAGANWYADQKLAAYYAQEQLSGVDDEVKIQYSNFKMGALQGTADWVMTLALDPCKANDVLVLQGQDKIRKSWNGYQIDSSYAFKSGNAAAKALLRGEQQAHTKINWLGKALTTVNIPRVDTQAEGVKVRLDPSVISIHAAAPISGEPKLTKFAMEIPAFTVLKGPSQILMQNVQFETTQGLNDAVLDSGRTRFSVASVQRLDTDLSGGIKNMEMVWNTEVGEKTVGFDGSFKIGELNVPNSPVTKDIVMNLEIQNLSLQRMQELSQVMRKAQKSCESAEFLRQDASDAFLKIVNEGFDFASKGNQISVGSGVGKANLTGKMMPGHHASVQSFVKMMPSLLSFKADLEFDKNLMKSISSGYSQAASAPLMTDQDIESMFSSLESSGQAKRSGDSLKMVMDYQFGQKMFLDPDK